MNIISEHGYRQDGRKPHQIRNLNYKLGVYSQANGSAYLEQGNTKVLCAVYGPHEPKQRSRLMDDRCIVNCQYSMATFSTNERKERPRGDRRSLEFARLMEKAFEAAVLTKNYPRSQIDIFCELLQILKCQPTVFVVSVRAKLLTYMLSMYRHCFDIAGLTYLGDGSHLAACINVGTLALVDAGVPMYGLVAAASCACTPSGLACVDVNSREEMGIIPRLTVATISGQDAIVLAELQNKLHKNHLVAILEAARKATAHVHSCLEAAVLTHIKSAIGLPSDDEMESDNI